MLPRVTLTVEECPRLDVPRLAQGALTLSPPRAAGTLRLRYGVLLHYRIDLGAAGLGLWVQGQPRWSYALLSPVGPSGRWRVRCPGCGAAAELLYWPHRQARADWGAGACGDCARLRWLGGYVLGTRASTGRLQPALRRAVQQGAGAGVVAAMATDPGLWLAGRQALEAEGLAPRKYTLEDGNRRRWTRLRRRKEREPC